MRYRKDLFMGVKYGLTNVTIFDYYNKNIYGFVPTATSDEEIINNSGYCYSWYMDHNNSWTWNTPTIVLYPLSCRRTCIDLAIVPSALRFI